MRTGRENRKRDIREGIRTPLYPDRIRAFRDQIKPGDIFWIRTDDHGLEKYSVLEKYKHFVRLKTERRESTSVISVQYIQLMIAEREAGYGSRL